MWSFADKAMYARTPQCTQFFGSAAPTRDLPTVGEGAFSVFITGIAIACNNSTIIHLMLTKEALEKKHLKRHMEFMSVGKI